jgi:phasin
MTQPRFEVPEGVRDLVDNSVDQTRNAFEAFWKASRAAVASVESTFPEAAREASAKALSYSEANIRAAFDHAQKLARAKNPQDFWQLQSDFVKAQSEALQEQLKEFTSAMQKVTSPKSGDAP